MDAAEERRAAARQAEVSEAEIARRRARESIELSIERIRREVAASTHPRHQEQLSAALAFLEKQLADLG
jgi:hypothetical protein